MILIICSFIAVIFFCFGFFVAYKYTEKIWGKMLYEFAIFECKDNAIAKAKYMKFIEKAKCDVAVESAKLRNQLFKYRS